MRRSPYCKFQRPLQTRCAPLAVAMPSTPTLYIPVRPVQPHCATLAVYSYGTNNHTVNFQDRCKPAVRRCLQHLYTSSPLQTRCSPPSAPAPTTYTYIVNKDLYVLLLARGSPPTTRTSASTLSMYCGRSAVERIHTVCTNPPQLKFGGCIQNPQRTF